MLRLSIRRVKPEKEQRLRAWLAELSERADEVRATFVGETVRHEQAYVLGTSDGPILVYAMETADFEKGRAAYAASTHPIDRAHRAVMEECLGERLGHEPVYDVSIDDEATSRPGKAWPEGDPVKSGSPREMMTAVAESMRDRTGRDLQEWVTLVGASGIDPLDQVSVRRWLKTEHGVLQNSQWAIADAAACAANWERPGVEEYVDQQYTGPKEILWPIFDRLRGIVEAFGDDVKLEGRATYVPFVRRRQFAAVAAATRARVDVGLRYTDAPVSQLLTPAKAPGQATHRLSLASSDEITSEVKRLLRAAYDQNG